MTGRKLGRGLDMLIAREEAPASAEILQLDPGKLEPNPTQPRKRFPQNELEMLKSSIAREGFLQPVVVRRTGEDAFQLVAGERRLRAAQELGLRAIPCVLMSVEEDRLLELALTENVQREDLNPIELAQGYRQLMEAKGWKQETLAEALGLSRSGVSNTLRLLDLPSDIQVSIARSHITMGHAKVLLSVVDPTEQRVLFEKIAEEKLTVRDLETERDRVGTSAATGPDGERRRGGKRRRAASAQTPPHVRSLEEKMEERLGTRVRIHERNGKGRLVIEFYSADDFERIRQIVLGS